MDDRAKPLEIVETTVASISEDKEGNPAQVNEYVLRRVLGQGSYAEVWLCDKIVDQKRHEFAMKIFNKSLLKKKREFNRVNGKTLMSNAFEKVQKEVAILKKLKHENLTRLYEVIDDPENDKLFLVLELVSGGQIMDWDDNEVVYKTKEKRPSFTEQAAKACIADLVMALEYLHANRICHRDIKPENILVTESNTYKLADFGVAHMFEQHDLDMKLRNTEGTYYFIAPECTKGEAFDAYKVDIWALGITLFALVTGTVPFGLQVAGMQAIVTAIQTDQLPLPSFLSTACHDLLGKLLHKDPVKRIDLQEIKKHPWLELDSRLEGKTLTPPLPIDVSPEDIMCAFTPVNNFIMMSVVKMKMSSKLAKLREKMEKNKTDQTEVVSSLSVSSSDSNPHDDKNLRKDKISSPERYLRKQEEIKRESRLASEGSKRAVPPLQKEQKSCIIA